MTISTTSSSTTTAGNNVAVTFTFPWVADQASDVNVYFVDAAGTASLLSPSQYTLVINAAGVGQLWGVGGFVTYPPLVGATPIATGTSLVIQRAVPDQQLVAISNQGGFYPQSVEQGLDILELQIQQLAFGLSRTLQVPIGSNLTPLQYIQAIIAAAIAAGGGSTPAVPTGAISFATSAYVVAVTDYTIFCNASSAQFPVTLPSAATYPGRVLNIKKVDSSVNSVVITGTVDGQINYFLSFANQSVTLQSNGTSWEIL